MCCDWNEGVSLEHNVGPVKEPLSAEAVNDPVLLRTDRKLVRPAQA